MTGMQKIDCFQRLSDTGKEILFQHASEVSCNASAIALEKGQKISGAYFVIEGLLRVYSLSPNGTQATLYTISPGETCVFAINCLFNDLLYPAWVEAETETTLAVVPGNTYRTLFQKEPSIQDITVSSLSTAVFRLMSELELVHGYSQTQRLANLLLLRASSKNELTMTQQQLASHLGTTREVVARLVGKLVALDYIETHRGLIRIKNIAGLSNILATMGE